MAAPVAKLRRCRPASWPPVCLALFAWLLTAAVPQASAQLPVARLWTLYPPGAPAGGTVEIAITGADLEDATQLYFSHGGLKAKPKPLAGSDKPEANKFLLSVEADAPPGVYEARVVGRFGISNPRAFTVGDRPEVLAPVTNTTAATATELVPGTIVNGRAVANAVQYFQFRATKGQRVFFECASQSIDSRLDAALVLTDAGGRELDRNRRGGGLDFTAPADGVFTLQVHDFLFRGGDEFFYRLSASLGPHLDFIFPPAGQVGSKSSYTLYGRNLPGGRPAPGQFVEGKPLEQLAVEIELPALEAATRSLTTSTLIRPREAFLDGIDHRLASPQGVSNPVRLGFATAPLVGEEVLGAPATTPVKLSLPAEYAGQFRARGQPTELRFEAKKGDAWWVEVFAQRLGWTASPLAVIQRVTRNDKGEEQFADVQELGAADTNLGGVEFNTTTRDPAARFEAKEDGLYRMLVRDLFNQAPGSPRCTYRVLIRRETPDFRLVALAPAPAPLNKDLREASAWTPFLRPGESLPLRVLVARQDGFKGEIELSVMGLPPGVTSSGAKLEGEKNSARLLLTADTNAAGWIGPIKVVGRARVGAEELVREARGGAVTWNVADYNNEAAAARLTRDFVLAVAGREPAPLTVAAAEDKVWETSVAGKLSIPLEVIRRGDFNGNVKLKGAAPALVEGLKEFEIDGKTNRATLELDLTQQKFAAGEFTIHLQAQSPGKYRRQTTDEVQSAEAQVKETEKSVTELAAALKSANEALGAAKKSADDAAAAVKAAEEKLAGTQSAADKTTAEAELATAKEKAKAATDARAAAEKTAGEAAAKSKDAEQKKEQAANRLKEMAPREVTVTTYSLPIRLKVAPAPITLTVPANAEPLAAGGKLELPVAFTRRFGFAEAVEVNLIWAKPVPGLGAPKLTVAKDQSEGKLVVEAAASVAAGDYTATVQAVLKLNGQELKVEQPVTFKIGGAKPS